MVTSERKARPTTRPPARPLCYPRSVSKLMPVLHAQQHDSYLRAYMTTGIAKVIGIPRQLRGKTKDGLTFPMELAVSRVETPAGITFAGIIHALPEDDDSVLGGSSSQGMAEDA